MHISRIFHIFFKVIYLKSHLPCRQSSNIVDPELKMFLMTADSFLQKQGSLGHSVPHLKSTIWFQRWSWRDLGCLLWWDYSVTSQHLLLWRRSKLCLLISILHSVVPELKLTEIVCSIQDWIRTDKKNVTIWIRFKSATYSYMVYIHSWMLGRQGMEVLLLRNTPYCTLE